MTIAESTCQAEPDASNDDNADHLNAKLGQLSAMLHLNFGENLERFNNMSDTVQGN